MVSMLAMKSSGGSIWSCLRCSWHFLPLRISRVFDGKGSLCDWQCLRYFKYVAFLLRWWQLSLFMTIMAFFRYDTGTCLLFCLFVFCRTKSHSLASFEFATTAFALVRLNVSFFFKCVAFSSSKLMGCILTCAIICLNQDTYLHSMVLCCLQILKFNVEGEFAPLLRKIKVWLLSDGLRAIHKLFGGTALFPSLLTFDRFSTHWRRSISP